MIPQLICLLCHEKMSFHDSIFKTAVHASKKLQCGINTKADKI